MKPHPREMVYTCFSMQNIVRIFSELPRFAREGGNSPLPHPPPLVGLTNLQILATPLPPANEREQLYEKRVHAEQRRVCVDTWTNRLVLRLPLQSGSDPLKVVRPRPDQPDRADFFFWTRFENLVAKRRKINDRVVPIL